MTARRPNAARRANLTFTLVPEPTGAGRLTATHRRLLSRSPASGEDILVALADTPLPGWLDAAEMDGDGLPRVRLAIDGLLLSARTVAELDDALAERLGCPPPTRLRLDLQSKGSSVFDPDFFIAARFLQPGGIPARAVRTGAFIRYEGRDWRCPDPVFSACVTAEALARPLADEAARMERFAALKAALPDDLQAEMSDGYLVQLRLLYAGGFSLDLDLTDGGVDFAPRLFAPSPVDEDGMSGDLANAEDSLLTPVEQKAFSEREFWQRPGTPAAYRLGSKNTYVYVPPHLRQALKVVREMRSAPLEERRRFVMSPRAVLAERLSADAREALEGLFVETQQYSERVAGIDVWTQTVLPWVKKTPNTWVPEAFGLMVGDVRLQLTPKTAAELKAKMEEASAGSALSVSFEDSQVPVNAQSLEAIREIVRQFPYEQPEEPDAAAVPTDAEAPETPAPVGPLFLTIHDNLEDVNYSEEPVLRPPVGDVVPPPSLRSTLKTHQVEGLTWMMTAARDGRGALLADDMGLGKTLQALTFLAKRRAEGFLSPLRPHLIVAPVALLKNWEAEMARHFEPGTFGAVEAVKCKGLDALRLTPKSAGRDTLAGRANLDASRLQGVGVVLTTYETLRDYHFSFAKVPFDTIVFDEVQKLKNPVSQMTRASKTLNAAFKLALTGTPVENSLHDVWSIVDVIWPGRLGSSRDFARTYEADVSKGAEKLRDELTGRRGTQTPLMLRRMKNGLLKDLPNKIFRPVQVEMPPLQAQAYADWVARGMSRAQGVSMASMLEVLQGLRSVSLHVSRPNGGTDDDDYVQQSARLTAMMATLKDVHRAGEKALIFIEDLAVQEFVARHVAKAFGLPRPLARIHGGVSGEARQAIVDRFQNGPRGFDALVLSPKAGGVGLTITAANHVIHLSRWWNPAVEDQATDRAYRIGQTKDVTVHIPQAVHPNPELRDHSFDLMLDSLLTRKRELSQTLLQPMNDDTLAGELYRSVFGGVGSREEEARTTEVVPAPAAEPAPPALPLKIEHAPRGILTLSKATPVMGAGQIKTSRSSRPAELWELHRGVARPFDEIFAFLSGALVSTVEIVDGYALVGDDIEFLELTLREIGRRAQTIESATIITRSPEHRAVRDTAKRTASEAIAAWRKMVKAELGETVSAYQKLKENHVEHDRWIDFRISQGGKPLFRKLRLPNGVKGFTCTRDNSSVTLE